MYSSSLISTSPPWSDAHRALAREDGYRVVVRLGEELAWRWADYVGPHPAALERPACASLSTPQHVASGVLAQRPSDRRLAPFRRRSIQDPGCQLPRTHFFYEVG